MFLNRSPASSSSPPGRSRRQVAAVVMGVALAALAIVAGLIGVGRWRGWPATLAAQDREALIVAAKLAPLVEFVLRQDQETFSKRRFFDGRVELAYAYDHPDPAAPFVLASRVIVAPNRAAARTFYEQLAARLDDAGAEEGYAFQELAAAAHWGDASRYGVLRDGNAVVGHALACRRGEKVLFLELSGVGLDEGRFGELVLPSLQSLDAYQP